jgi:hypothetical protein
MPQARSLKDLLRIRAANRDLIESVNDNLGSALGFKRPTGGSVTDEPAVLIFVPRKIDNCWLPASQQIPKVLQGPDGLTCPTDVVEGGSYKERFLKLYEQDGNPVASGGAGVVPWSYLIDEPALSPDNVDVLEILHGWSEKMFAGSRLAGKDPTGLRYTGTAGCFVRDRSTGKRGILTNQHVADHTGNVLKFPWFNGKDAGTAVRLFEYVHDEGRFPGIVNLPNEFYWADCAFLELSSEIADSTNLELPRVGPIGAPLALDLDTMGPLGRRVTSVGSRRGVQSGAIVAFSYEFYDGVDSVYTDYLIIGDEDLDENGRQITRTAFSDHGDSGKIIVTDDGQHNVVALLWGGWQERLRSGKMQENWTYAIDINFVLDLLNVDLDG